jgi:hypothetical protein
MVSKKGGKKSTRDTFQQAKKNEQLILAIAYYQQNKYLHFIFMLAMFLESEEMFVLEMTEDDS